MFIQRLRIPGLDLESDLSKLSAFVHYLIGDGRHRHRFIKYASKTDDLAALHRTAAGIRASFQDVVVLATGGAALGAKALIRACVHEQSGAGGPRFHFQDNLSAYGLERLLRTLDLRATHFLVISKSGRTMETLAQFLIFLEAVRSTLNGADVAPHFTVITSAGENPLRRLAEAEKLTVFEHDPDLDGRYSVFSPVGVLPMLAAGLDAERLRDGAAAVLERVFRAANMWDIPSAIGAAANFRLARDRGCSVQVLMSYDQRLTDLALWHRQLWAESLGKNGCGTTPVTAFGPVDQHSQLQFYMDGPADKFFTVMTTGSITDGPMVPEAPTLRHPELFYLARQQVGGIVAAEAQATIEILGRAGRPLRCIAFVEPNEKTLGALMMHFMMETVFAAHLFGVDPYGQPAVEEGKKLAIAHLSYAAAPKVAGTAG